MIVGIYSSDGGEYYIDSQYDDWGFKIDVTQKFYDRYLAYEAEREFIQSKLHRYYEDCQKQEIIKKSKDGIKPIGF